ncbi:Centromere protein J (CENP-J) (Centrosomal P4.1-associated protein) (LAG-3-associated protein) (LYST-interacting protein 1), partial [Durusdinium trenchii]
GKLHKDDDDAEQRRLGNLSGDVSHDEHKSDCAEGPPLSRKRSMDAKVITLSNGSSLHVYADGRKVQHSPDGTVIESYPDGTKVQISPAGVKIEVRPNGSRVQTNPDGTKLEIMPDGGTTQTSPDGTVVEIRKDGSRTQRNPDGVVINIAPDGSRFQEFPDGTVIEIRPDGSKFQTNSDGTQLNIASNGHVEKHASGSSSGRSAQVASGDSSKSVSSPAFLQQKISSLLKENNQLKDTLRFVENKASEDVQATKKETQEEMQKVIDQLTEAHEKAAKAEQLENALLESTSELDKVKQQFESLKTTHDVSVKDLQTSLEKVTEDKARLETFFENRLKEETASLQEQIKSLEELTKKNAENMQLSGNDTSAELTTTRTKLLSAESKLRDAEARAEQLSQELQASGLKDSESSELRNRVKKLQDSLALSEEDKEALHAQVEDLIFKGGSCAEQLNDLKKERDRAVEDRETSYAKLADITEKMVEAVSSLTERENELADAYNELSQLRQNATLNADPSGLDKALQAERKRSKELEAKLRSGKDVEAEAKLADANKQLEAQVRVIAQLEQRVQSFDNQFSRAKEMQSSSLENLRHRLEHAELHLKEVQEELDAANEDRDSLRGQLAAMAPSSPRSVGSNAEADDKNERLQREVTELQTKLARRERELDEQVARVADLEQMQALSTPIESVKAVDTSTTRTALPGPAGMPSGMPARPPAMAALLGQLQGGASNLKKTPQDAEARPARPVNPLLAAIQQGAKLKSVADDEGRPPAKRPGPPGGGPSMPSFAELCQLKAKQRAHKSQRIDDLLAKNKEKSAATISPGNAELQRALAKRAGNAKAA